MTDEKIDGLETRKICTNCLLGKDLNAYHQDKYTADNLSSWCKDCRKTYKQRYYLKNKDKIKQQMKSYGYSHKNERNRYVAKRKQTDPSFRLAVSLRIRLLTALKKNLKAGSAVRDLGCSIPDLKVWLEQQFQPGMTWENYGSKWHIDHIIPLNRFDLTDRKQFLKACHWFNLRPLWAEENYARPKRGTLYDIRK